MGDRPLVIYLNHASWWDPLIGMLLARQLWPSYTHYAPIDAAALTRYPIFSRIGFFGVEANTTRGAATFLRSSLDILQAPRSAIWITGEGQFRDPRARPVELRPGVAHLARRTSAAFIPLAIEYPFWEERYPEALCRFGAPILRIATEEDISSVTARLSQQMQINQDALASESIARAPDTFTTLLRGKVGVNVFYDAFRWVRATMRGEQFQKQHGEHSP